MGKKWECTWNNSYNNVFVGLWEVTCIQLPQWSQKALPDNLWVASTNSPALRYEQRVLLNTGSSNGEYDKSLSTLSNIFLWGLCDCFLLLQSIKTFWFSKHKIRLDLLAISFFPLPFSVFISICRNTTQTHVDQIVSLRLRCKWMTWRVLWSAT